MYYEKLAKKSNIIKENHIEGYLGCCEIGGNDNMTFDNDKNDTWYYILLCNRGEIVISSPESHVTIRRGIINLSTSTSYANIEYRKNCHGYIIAIDKKLLFDIIRNRNPFPSPTQGFFGVQMHHSGIELQTMRILSKDCRNMIGALGNKEHSLLEELNYAHLYIFLTDIADIVWRHMRVEQVKAKDHGTMNRPQEITMQFLDLVRKHVEKETTVGFYADKLYISKQYLSEIILSETGVTAGKLIAKVRYESCLRYMNNPAYSIKQIADTHSFTDQSAFGKFFKQYSGKSPAQYRKEIKISLLSHRDSKSI